MLPLQLMWTLDERINALKPELDEWKRELQVQLKTLREAENHLAVLLAMAPLCLRLLEQVYKAAGKQPPPITNLHDWIKNAYEDQIIPSEIADYLHELRRRHNQAQHDPMAALALKPEDAEIALLCFLRTLEWFYCDCPHGPKMRTIYNLPSKPPHRRVFIAPPIAPNFLDRENELSLLFDWIEQEGKPVFVIGSIGGQGKTYLAAKFIERIRLAEKAVQIRWVECNEGLKLDDLLQDFAEEMEGRNVSEARIIKDSGNPLLIRLDALVRYLEHTPEQWLLVMDDFHKLLRTEGDWDEFVRFIDQRCRRSKLLIITRREPEVLDEPKLPVGAYEDLKLPELPIEMAQRYLAILGLNVDEETAEAIWKKCSGSPLAMKLFSQAAKRRSVEEVLSLLLTEWSEGTREWLDELQRDLSDEAKETLKRLVVLSCSSIELKKLEPTPIIEKVPVEPDLLLAVGATEKGIEELERAYFLDYDEEGRFSLHDLLWDYWMELTIKETLKELGEEIEVKVKGLNMLEIYDIIHTILKSKKNKIIEWLISASEWVMDYTEDYEDYIDRTFFSQLPEDYLYFAVKIKLEEGDIKEAERLCFKILSWHKKCFPSGDFHMPAAEYIIDILMNLGNIAIENNDYSNVKKYSLTCLQFILNNLVSINHYQNKVRISLWSLSMEDLKLLKLFFEFIKEHICYFEVYIIIIEQFLIPIEELEGDFEQIFDTDEDAEEFANKIKKVLLDIIKIIEKELDSLNGQ